MVENSFIGVSFGDQDPDLIGAVAVDHHGRLGLITSRRRNGNGDLTWYGLELEGVGHWRWTAIRPLVVARSLKELVEATDDQLGLTELRRRQGAGQGPA